MQYYPVLSILFCICNKYLLLFLCINHFSSINNSQTIFAILPTHNIIISQSSNSAGIPLILNRFIFFCRLANAKKNINPNIIIKTIKTQISRLLYFIYATKE